MLILRRTKRNSSIQYLTFHGKSGKDKTIFPWLWPSYVKDMFAVFNSDRIKGVKKYIGKTRILHHNRQHTLHNSHSVYDISINIGGNYLWLKKVCCCKTVQIFFYHVKVFPTADSNTYNHSRLDRKHHFVFKKNTTTRVIDLLQFHNKYFYHLRRF